MCCTVVKGDVPTTLPATTTANASVGGITNQANITTALLVGHSQRINFVSKSREVPQLTFASNNFEMATL